MIYIVNKLNRSSEITKANASSIKIKECSCFLYQKFITRRKSFAHNTYSRSWTVAPNALKFVVHRLFYFYSIKSSSISMIHVLGIFFFKLTKKIVFFLYKHILVNVSQKEQIYLTQLLHILILLLTKLCDVSLRAKNISFIKPKNALFL